MRDSHQEIRFAENCPFTVADLHALWHLAGWSKPGERTEEKTARAIDRSDFHVCAFVGERMIGFARICGDPYIVQVLDVLVHPDHRRQGIAKEIMRRVVTHLEKANYISVTLTDGSGLNEFYENLGFRRVDPASPQRVFRPTVSPGEFV